MSINGDKETWKSYTAYNMCVMCHVTHVLCNMYQQCDELLPNSISNDVLIIKHRRSIQLQPILLLHERIAYDSLLAPPPLYQDTQPLGVVFCPPFRSCT